MSNDMTESKNLLPTARNEYHYFPLRKRIGTYLVIFYFVEPIRKLFYHSMHRSKYSTVYFVYLHL